MRRLATGLLLISGLVAASPPEISPEPHSEYVISRDELRKGRPANGFKLVFAEPGQEAVCDTALGALNEPGYDTRHFNTSDKFDNSLSELLIQTRLNVPRTLLGTHLFRTEEYQVDNNKTGKKEYWYRLIRENAVILGYSYANSEPWFNKHDQKFSDFMVFLEQISPDNIGAFQQIRLSNNWNSEWQRGEVLTYIARTNDKGMKDIINARGSNYIISIDTILDNNIYILISEAIHDSHNICLIRSVFILTKR